MLKIIFNDDLENPVIANFRKTNDNIVTLDYVAENTSGFKVYRMKDDLFLGDYSEFTTVYRITENKISYSNDGSVYVEPEYPEIEDFEEDVILTEEEELANMSLEQRITECEECIMELSSVVYAG